MNSTNRDPHMRHLTRAARVAGRAGGMQSRTHYLDAKELQAVPVSRLVRETAYVENPQMSEPVREQRRGLVADEFSRRGFSSTADDLRVSWDETEVARARAESAEVRAQQATREAEAQQYRAQNAEANKPTPEQPSIGELAVVATATGVLAGVGSEIAAEQADAVLQNEAGHLDAAWEGLSGDPAFAGQIDSSPGGVEADIADSLAMSGPSAAMTPDVSSAPVPEATASPDVTI